MHKDWLSLFRSLCCCNVAADIRSSDKVQHSFIQTLADMHRQIQITILGHITYALHHATTYLVPTELINSRTFANAL